MNDDESDQFFMKQALVLAQQAESLGEVPIGCVLVSADGVIIGEGFNQPIMSHDPTAHAEIIALRKACLDIKNYRLHKSIRAYVTLEPCIMCAGALLNARVGRLVIGAKDSRSCSIHQQLDFYSGAFGNHKISTTYGVCKEEASLLLNRFFKDRR